MSEGQGTYHHTIVTSPIIESRFILKFLEQNNMRNSVKISELIIYSLFLSWITLC